MNDYTTNRDPRQQKPPPDPDTQAFIEVTYRMRAGQLNGTTPQEIAKLSPYWRERASPLYEAYKEGGEPGFWQTFDSISLGSENKKLRDVRALIQVEPEIGPELVGTLLSDVIGRDIEWLWYGKLALGKVQMFDGMPDIGKTTIIYDLIARASRGDPMPGESKRSARVGSIIITGEEDLEDTVQPKLVAAKADLSRVLDLSYIDAKTPDGKPFKRPFQLISDFSLLEKAIQRVNAKIIFIDPLMGILGGRDTYRDTEVRVALAPLVSLLQKHRVVAICMRHAGKGKGGETLMYQGIGSVAFIGLSRIGLMAIESPDNESQGIFFTPKNNLIPKAHRTKLLYTIVSDTENPAMPRVRWDGITSISDQELITRPQDNQGGKRAAIYRCLQACSPQARSPQQIAEELEIDVNTVTVTLKRMYDDGQIDKQGRGLYYVPSTAA